MLASNVLLLVLRAAPMTTGLFVAAYFRAYFVYRKVSKPKSEIRAIAGDKWMEV